MTRRTAITGAAYQVFAEGIRRIEDENLRLQVADHFARYFASRSPSFDPQAWFQATGGLVNRREAA